jgi:hypothetical protein
MFWVVQSNLYKEHSFQELIRLLTVMEIPYTLVKPLPFTLKLAHPDADLSGQDIGAIEEPYIDNNQPIMVCGAYTMSKIAKDRGWTPGAFINENFEFDAWCKNWGKENMLNGNAIVSTVGEVNVPDNWTKLFARPTEDTKSFAGKVFHRDDFRSWISSVRKIEGFSTLEPDTRIMIAPLQNIFCEYRLFVVDKKIVTGSLYKLRDQVIYNSLIDQSVLDYANKMIEMWQPDRAFVMDVAITSEGHKIVEINNINSSGFYASDLSKFIMAIEDMGYDKDFSHKKNASMRKT